MGLAAATVVATAVVATPLELLGGGEALAIAFDALVFGGLLAAAVVVVYLERVDARRCDRCGRGHERAAAVCAGCGYDLAERPRYSCDRRHGVAFEPGLCRCGRRLQRLAPLHDVNRRALAVLKLGGWALAFLLSVGLVLRWLAS